MKYSYEHKNLQTPKTELYAVAFIDILGAKEKILNDENDEYLKTVNSAEKMFLALIDYAPLVFDRYIEYRVFSDNIVIARKVSRKKINIALNAVIKFAASYQICLLASSIIVRGGISLGKFYINDTLVWGEALVKAYQIESQTAKYPRIILDSAIDTDGLRYIKTDSHGMSYADAMFTLNIMKEYNLHAEYYCILRDALIKEVTFTTLSSAKEKLHWLIKYFNSACKEYGLSEYIIGELHE